MHEMVHRAVDVSVRSLNKEDRTVDIVMSTDAIDSYNERVAQEWDLKRYLANPIVLWAHNSRELPLGRSSSVKVIGGKLQCTVTFASEKANPRAEQVFQLFCEGILRASSVGFVPRKVRTQMEGDNEVTVLGDNELHELSIVCVPANPEALAKANEKAGAERTAKGKTMLTEAEIESMKSTLAEREATIATFATTESALVNERAKTAALELQVKTVSDERDVAMTALDAQKVENAKQAAAIVEAEVSALVGVKITPAEKDEFVELANTNRPLFEKMVAKRGDLGILGPKILTPETEPVGNVDVKSGGDELVGLALAAASQDESL